MDIFAQPIAEALKRDGFAFVRAPEMEATLRRAGFADWPAFASSWDDLGADFYMADGGRYRRRRFGAFAVSAGEILRKPHQPHYQSRDYNPLNGGLERWFSPIADEIGAHPAMQAILRVSFGLFDELTPAAARPDAWHVEAHQFRIEATAGEAGLPTPEGLHRDGVDWVLVLLVRRRNVESGETTIHDLSQKEVGAFTLEQPLDAAFVDDARVYHGVTPVRPLDKLNSACRDVLVLTFRR